MFESTPAEIRAGAPLLGAHTYEVLGEIGYSEAEIDAMVDAVIDATTKWPCLDGDRLQDGFGAGSAANAAYFDRNQMQARRLRRQTRLSRVGRSLKVGGWSVRSW